MKAPLLSRTTERLFDALWRALDRLGSLALFRVWKMPPHRNSRTPVARRTEPRPHADERTIRRIAEAQRGGMSSDESARRYAQGDNPGGTHGFRAVRHDGPP